MPHARLKKVKEYFSNHGSIYWQQNKYAAEILSNSISKSRTQTTVRVCNR